MVSGRISSFAVLKEYPPIVFFYNRQQAQTVYNYIKGGKRNKPLLLYGPPGTGKTASVRSAVEILKRKGINVILTEIHASENVIKELEDFKSKYKMRSIFAYNVLRVLFINEIDYLSSRELTRIANTIDKIEVPIILEATDIWSPRLGKIRALCQRVEYKPIPPGQMVTYLQQIARRHNIPVTIGVLQKIAQNANGDMRAAIIDLFSCRKTSDLEERDFTINIFAAFRRALSSKTVEDARRALELSGEDLRKLLIWTSENVAHYSRKPAYDFELLTLADKLLHHYQYSQAMEIMATTLARGLRKARVYMPVTVGKTAAEWRAHNAALKSAMQKIAIAYRMSPSEVIHILWCIAVELEYKKTDLIKRLELSEEEINAIKRFVAENSGKQN